MSDVPLIPRRWNDVDISGIEGKKYFITGGTSGLGKASAAALIRREGRAEGRWILLDFGDLVVHVFHEEERMYYGLERLWKDCPAIPLEFVQHSPDVVI